MTYPLAPRQSKTLAFLAFLLVPAVALAGDPVEDAPAADPQSVWGGQDTEPCAWPTTVQVTGAGSLCSGSLIHPKVVMYAAHCGAQDKVVRFGDSQNTLKTKQVEYCKVNPAYTGQSQTNDWAYCVLAEEMTAIPFTPVGFGCEVNQYLNNGQTVAVVGFGNDSGDTGAGRKRWAFTTISNLQNGRFDVGGGGQPTICSGDSGGPAFIKYGDNSWHVYGIASTKNSGTCDSARGTHSNAVNAVQWIENDSGIDVTPCHDLNGTWNPTALCGNFSNAQPGISGGSWATWCKDTTALDWSATCGTDFETLFGEVNPPELSFVIPSEGEVFSDVPTVLDITVDVFDDTQQPVAVDIQINGQPAGGTTETDPAVWGGAEFPPGEYTILAHGVDFWGNEANTEVHFTVEDPNGGTTTGGDTTGDGGGDGTDGTDDSTADAGSADEIGDTGFDPPADTNTDGCACNSAGSKGAPGLGLGLLALLGLVRRRRRGG